MLPVRTDILCRSEKSTVFQHFWHVFFSTYSTTWDTFSVSLNTQEMIFLEYRFNHTSKMHKSFTYPNIHDIWTPGSIWMSRIEFLVKDIFKFLAEIRIYGCLDIWFHPMGLDSWIFLCWEIINPKNWKSEFRYSEITYFVLDDLSISAGRLVKTLPHLRCVAVFTNVPAEIIIRYAQKQI